MTDYDTHSSSILIKYKLWPNRNVDETSRKQNRHTKIYFEYRKFLKGLVCLPIFALTWQQLKMENNKLNIYRQYLLKSTFETIWLFFHRPVGLVELLILYVRVQFYTPQASDYRLISKTASLHQKHRLVLVIFTLNQKIQIL